MDIVPAHLALVNQQVEFHRRRAEQFTKEHKRQKPHMELVAKFSELAAYVQMLEKAVSEGVGGRHFGPIQLSLSLEEVKDLPDELVKELSISDSDRTDFVISSLIDEAGGVITLDRLLIGLYRKTGEIHKRQALTNRLYRMGQKGLVFNVPGRKGAYSTQELTEEQASLLVG